MNQIEALRRLQDLKTPAFETRDTPALFGASPANAHMILRRLADRGFLIHVARGRWALADRVSRFALPGLLAAPYPAYVSLQSALFHHGLIEQVPAVTYAVTLGRPRRVKTGLGTISLHRMPPELFDGFEVHKDGSLLAQPEKALFDLLYLGPGKSRLFARLPELHIGHSFRWPVLQEWVEKLKSPSRRGYLLEQIKWLRYELRRSARR